MVLLRRRTQLGKSFLTIAAILERPLKQGPLSLRKVNSEHRPIKDMDFSFDMSSLWNSLFPGEEGVGRIRVNE